MTSPSDDSFLNKFLSLLSGTAGIEDGTYGNLEVGSSTVKTSGKLIQFSEHGLLTEKEVSFVSGMTIHTLRKRRQLKLPPEYIKIDRRVYYKDTDLERYLGFKITSENG